MKRVLVLCLLGCLPASALVRMAIIIGNNQGLEGEKPLLYAARDAEQVHAALEQLGGLDKGRSYLLQDMTVSRVAAAFKEANGKIRSLRAENRKVQLLVYYSGHGSGDALHMRGDRLPLSRIRQLFTEADADLKLLVVDACYSGSLINTKGAALAAPAPVTFRDELNVNGSAILTSSSALELSQESRDLRGSLFTHFFLAGIRGAADADRDGLITLWEAYNFTQSGLRRKLAGTAHLAQNPEFDVDIHGSDNVVLTRLSLGRSFLVLKGMPAGQYQVLDGNSARSVAELELSGPEPISMALPQASYLVYGTTEKTGLVGHADLRNSRSVQLGPENLRSVALEALTAKGLLDARGLARLDTRPYQFSLQPRLHSRFPGRAGTAVALETSFQRNLGDWGVQVGLGYLPRYRSGLPGAGLIQEGWGAAGEIRYYWSTSRLGGAFLGPRVELWSLGQAVDGRDLPRGRTLGGFAALGLERRLPFSLCLSLSLAPGRFWSYDAGGDLRGHPDLPVALGLRFGP